MTDQERIMLIEADQRSKNNLGRINELESDIKEIANEQKAIYKIATSVEVIAQRVSSIESKVDETYEKVNAQTEAWRTTKEDLSNKINHVESNPDKQMVKNLNSLKVSVITAIAAAMATGIASVLLSLLNN